MTRAVGMFGSDAAAKRLHTKLRSERVYIERHNFRHPDDVLARLAEAPEIAALLLVEKALRELDPDIGKTLESLRAGDATVRIIFIKDEPERDYPFELWCYEHGIYDIAYPSRHTDVNIDAIRDAVLLGRIDPDNPPPPPVECLDTQSPRTARGRGLNIAEIKLPDWKLPEWNIPSLSEFMRRPKREPQEDIYRPEPEAAAPPPNPQTPVMQTIGVINCSRGFGATSLVVGMAGVLTSAGHSVAAVAMDASPDLSYSGLEDMGVTVVIPSADELPDWKALKAEHDFLLIDFGAIFEFLPSGGVIPAQSSAGKARAVQEAMNLCDLRIYLASTEPWHRRKAKAFSPDEKGYVLPRQEADASIILHTIGAT